MLMCRSQAQQHPHKGTDVGGKADVKVQDSCKKTRQVHWRFYRLPLSSTALGRTKMQKLLFHAAEKMSVGFPRDLLASADAACGGWAVWAA